MEPPSLSPPKKSLGPLAWIGIGCGGIIVLGILAAVIVTVMFGGQLKQFAVDAQKNPTRLTATAMVNLGAGTFEMVAEDDANKRYTVREKKTGKLTTIYWDKKEQAPKVISGDFSAIPESEEKAPEPESTAAERK